MIEDPLITPPLIGGQIVEIDESLIGNRKYNRGKRVKGKWILGSITGERESKENGSITGERESNESGFSVGQREEATTASWLNAKTSQRPPHPGQTY